MNLDEIRKSIKYLYKLKVKSITLTGGGEPTLNPDFAESIKYAGKHKIDTGIITNGINLHQSDIITILSYAKWCRISLDAGDNTTYQHIRGVSKYEQVITNIKDLLSLRKLLKSNCTIGVQIVVNRYNYQELTLIYQELLFQFPDIDYIQFRTIEIKIGDNPYSEDQLSFIFSQLERLSKKPKAIINDKWDLFRNDREFCFKACYAADFIGTVDVHGDFYLCCHTVKNKKYKFINIFESENFIEERKKIISALGKNKGLNKKYCPVGCRGSQINIALEKYLEETHKNFL
jgi:MoaA/NifB/PqqE/SkfB family radical SAM enzyme